ncbi:MAG: foldase protein PrsA [Thermodesulfobacteriota bacterium]
MKKLFLIFTLTFFVFCSTVSISKEDENILARVGNYIITKIDFDQMVKEYELMRRGQKLNDQEKRMVLDNIVKNFLIVNEAERLKMDKKAEIESQLKIMKMKLLMKEYVNNMVEPKIKISDKEIDEYMKQTQDLIPKEGLMLREIVVKSEEEAKTIYEELKRGGDFSKIAVEKSISPTKIYGGRLKGEISRGKLPKELEEVAFKLKVGEFSKPTKTDQGYVILLLDSRKERTQKEIDELKGKIRGKIEGVIKQKKIGEIMEKKVEELSKNIKIEKYYDRIQ